MPNEKQDLTNHRQVAVACKNYTDKEIKKSEERILSIVARNNIDFIDHINEPTYRFTAPANSKLLMLQSIAGNSNKIAPSTPSDDSIARIKAIPENTYKSQVDYIGGKSVKYNQLVQNGNFEDTSGWVSGSQIASKTASNNVLTITTYASTDSTYVGQNKNFINGHKYLVLFEVKNNDNNTSPYGFFRVGTFGSTYYANNNIGATFTKCYKLFEFVETSGTYALYVGARTSTAVALNYSIRGVEFIDLTDKFGAGNEPSDVASAIPLLKANGYKLDGTDTYSTGSLKHTVVSGVKYNSINVWDEEWELGNIPSGTGIKEAGTRVMSKNYIKVLPNTTYYFKFPLYATSANWRLGVYQYKEDYSYIVTETSFISTNVTVTTGSQTHYMLILLNNDYGTTYKNDICINISNASYNGNYYPYVAPITKAIPSEVLADNRYGLGFDNTNYNHLDIDGHLRGSWDIVDLGTLDYSRSNNGGAWNNYLFFVQLSGVSSNTINLLCALYNVTTNDTITMGNKTIKVRNGYLYIRDDSYTDATTFKTAMSGVYLVYELATAFDQDYSQYFTPNWNKVDLDKQYASCEMVCDESIDMPNKVEYYGTIIHSLATEVKQDGFNIWDEEWEVGGIVSGTLNSKNYIEVIPNATYYYYCSATSSGNCDMYFYDKDKNQIGIPSGKYNQSFTIPSNCRFIRFRMASGYGTTYNNDICINISGTLNGTYKPYKAPITRLLPNSEAKYSWGITDGVRNTRVFCDDEGNAVNEGSLVVNNVDMGSKSWNLNNVGNFYSDLSDFSARDLKFICAKYTNSATAVNGYDTLLNDKEISNWGKRIFIHDSTYLTAETFNSSLSSEMLYYEKATTDTETLDDFDFFFDCEEGDTFTLVNTEQLQCYATYSFLIKEAKSNE